jgi:hypothetical protein
MIKGLMGSRGIAVNGGDTSVPYVNQNVSNPVQGMIRVWGNDMQVFDGSNWMNITTSYATVGLDPVTQEAIDWVKQKMQDEKELHQLSKENPAVQIALENLKRAREQLDVTIILSKEHEKSTS